jgi:hypothetical protein
MQTFPQICLRFALEVRILGLGFRTHPSIAAPGCHHGVALRAISTERLAISPQELRRIHAIT